MDIRPTSSSQISGEKRRRGEFGKTSGRERIRDNGEKCLTDVQVNERMTNGEEEEEEQLPFLFFSTNERRYASNAERDERREEKYRSIDRLIERAGERGRREEES